MDTKKRILVTGGAGFVGSNLCRVLLGTGASVDCVDNLITGRSAAVDALLESPRFRFFRHDTSDPSFPAAFDRYRYDEIYHLACPTGVPNVERFGEEMLRTCSYGMDNVLRLASRQQAKLLYTSSAEVYGNPEVFPQTEDYCGRVDPTGPRSAYEEGKRFGEALVTLYVDKYQLEGKIVRIFNTFGIGMSPQDTRLIPSFVSRMKSGEKLVIYGDGEQTRTHLYIDDLIAGLMLVMEKGHSGEVYNIGGENELTINELADLIRQLTPMPTEIEHRPHFTEDHAGRRPALSKIKQLGWSPSVDIRTGLYEMLKNQGVPVEGEADPAIPSSFGRNLPGPGPSPA